VLSRAFVERLIREGSADRLPWHRAEKKVSVLDETGRRCTPQQPNVVKLEQFVFDAIPLADNPIVVYTERAEEFSPVKNAVGVDSPETARRDQIRRAAHWLESCGVSIPRRSDGEPDAVLEISPAFALDRDDLAERLRDKPPLVPGDRLLLLEEPLPRG